MAKFKFHGTLRDHVAGGEVIIDGDRSVAESLSEIAEAHASLKKVLYVNGADELHDFYRVLVNDEMVEFLDDGMETRLSAKDVVQVFPPVSGGQ
jgi:molybdopterin converting factor small subunit